MATLKVGDLTVCLVTGVGGSTPEVIAAGMRGIIAGPLGAPLKVGDHLKVRVVELKSDGRFVAVRLPFRLTGGSGVRCARR